MSHQSSIAGPGGFAGFCASEMTGFAVPGKACSLAARKRRQAPGPGHPRDCRRKGAMPPGATKRAYCESPRAQYSSRCLRLEPAQEDLTAKFAKDRKEC